MRVYKIVEIYGDEGYVISNTVTAWLEDVDKEFEDVSSAAEWCEENSDNGWSYHIECEIIT